jgi:hypothetical protein
MNLAPQQQDAMQEMVRQQVHQQELAQQQFRELSQKRDISPKRRKQAEYAAQLEQQIHSQKAKAVQDKLLSREPAQVAQAAQQSYSQPARDVSPKRQRQLEYVSKYVAFTMN